jgi:hypothetical protein
MARLIAAVIAGLAVALALEAAPGIAAGGLLYPARRDAMPARPPHCVDREFRGDAVTLRGWHCRAAGHRRGTLVYLHGIADNRGSSVGVTHRYATQGFDVIAYDSRRHGTSDGDACTYGFFEKRDLERIMDAAAGPIVLMGTSLGAAVALQAAAIDTRPRAVVAAEVFSDLRRVASERAPWFLPAPVVRKALRAAERRGGFAVDDVDVVASARAIRAPVLLIHGAADADTGPDHSRRVYAALAGPKRLIEVPGAGHNESLAEAAVWAEIDRWFAAVAR